MDKKFLLLTKYKEPWLGVPLLKNLIEYYNNKIIIIGNKQKKNLIFNLINLNINLYKSLDKYDRVIIYDYNLLFLSYPILKFISLYKKIECYYIFESKWFNKLGDYLSPLFKIILNDKLFEKIFVFDELLGSYLISKGINNKKFINISTGIDINIFYPNEKKFTNSLIYAGSIDKRRRLEIMIKVIRIIKNEFNNINLLIIGGGNDLENLKNLSKELNLDNNITFLGQIDQEKVSDYIRKSDICLAQYPPDIFDIQLPYKTLEYMACKKPVITTETIATKKYFKDKENVILTKFNEKSLADGIMLLIKNRNLREKISKNGYKLSKNFRWEKVIKIINDELK